jgi:hypothetical protein
MFRLHHQALAERASGRAVTNTSAIHTSAHTYPRRISGGIDDLLADSVYLEAAARPQLLAALGSAQSATARATLTAAPLKIPSGLRRPRHAAPRWR